MNIKQTEGELSKGTGSEIKRYVKIWNLTDVLSPDDSSPFNSLSIDVFTVESVAEKNDRRSLGESRSNWS
jgi:hypothetical protein